MGEAKRTQPTGLTTGKAVLVGVLAAILLGVLCWQFGSTAGTATAASSSGKRRMPSVAGTKPAVAANNVKKMQADKAPLTEVSAVVDAAKWKTPPLAEVALYDPLAVPAAFPKPKALDPKAGKGGLVEAAEADDAKKMAEAVAQLQMQLRELEQRGVQVIVRERDQFAALIGDRLVHIGDEIDGFTVTSIDPASGVRVERKSTQ